jgi:hypothetical protein
MFGDPSGNAGAGVEPDSLHLVALFTECDLKEQFARLVVKEQEASGFSAEQACGSLDHFFPHMRGVER